MSGKRTIIRETIFLPRATALTLSTTPTGGPTSTDRILHSILYLLLIPCRITAHLIHFIATPFLALYFSTTLRYLTAGLLLGALLGLTAASVAALVRTNRSASLLKPFKSL